MKSETANASRRSWALGFFAVAMGAFEAILVVYLRRLFYPEGFEFPIVRFPNDILIMEMIREFSTICMIAAVAYISAKRQIERLAWFLYIFAIWDIFYYIFLKLLIDWPSSPFTWDILFLIPVAWAGPVIAPIICSVTMLIMSFLIIYPSKLGYSVKLQALEWIFILTGALVIFIVFISDYSLLIIRGGFINDILSLGKNEKFWRAITQYVPTSFSWHLFVAGELLIVIGLALYLRKILDLRFTSR